MPAGHDLSSSDFRSCPPYQFAAAFGLIDASRRKFRCTTRAAERPQGGVRGTSCPGSPPVLCQLVSKLRFAGLLCRSVFLTWLTHIRYHVTMKCPHCRKDFQMGVNSENCPHCSTELFLSQCGVCRGAGVMENTEETPQPACDACDGYGWIVSVTPLGE